MGDWPEGMPKPPPFPADDEGKAELDPKDADGLTHYDRLVNPKRTRCAACGNVARGMAFVDGKRFCHPDDGPSCYVAQGLDPRYAGRSEVGMERLVEVVWRCRDCGCDITEPHKPECLFAPKGAGQG